MRKGGMSLGEKQTDGKQTHALSEVYKDSTELR